MGMYDDVIKLMKGLDVPFAHLRGRCEMRSTEHLPEGTEEVYLVTVADPLMVGYATPEEPRYLVIGRPHAIAHLQSQFAALWDSEDMVPAIVYAMLQMVEERKPPQPKPFDYPRNIPIIDRRCRVCGGRESDHATVITTHLFEVDDGTSWN